MRFFNAHLNWTATFGYLIALTLSESRILIGELPTMGDLMIGTTFLLIVSWWVIAGKRRALWWLLLFPFFSPLWLKNKSLALKEN